MNFQTREQALSTLSNITRREMEHRHVVILGYILSMNVDLNDYPQDQWANLSRSGELTLSMNSATIVDNVAHLLFEYTTLTSTEVNELRHITTEFLRWRLAVATGTICDRIAIYGEMVGTTEIIARLYDYIEPMTLNGITQLINRDEEFVNALANLVRAEKEIVCGTEGD